ncbi:N-acetylneuraminate lyase B-like isoform X1 [Phymastichus coffea]|uniref:N-acetylneuraminate lyase B-like isoform X1 n=1 Tax=Phymastichus coffea TaxID=108790 RepID=UPI00273B76DD|nr:N-acetylneuraminate lyase B-like isoform X1 [Phymastichus coffea]
MTNPVKFSFKGVIATAFAPFEGRSAERLNLSAIPEYAKYFAENHFKAVLVNGTYGEGMAMTVDERIQVANAWAEAAERNNQQIIVQVGGTNLQDVKTLAAHAQSINANAILCLPELYYKSKTVQDLIDYLAEVAASAPTVPLFYYHSPDATGVALNMVEFFKKVGDTIPSLGGIKFASTKLDECTLAVKAAADKFRVVVASNYILPACIAIGVDTFMPTSINIAPKLVNGIYDSAMSGDISSAQALQLKLVDVINGLSAIDKNVMPVMKAVTRRLLMPTIDIGSTRKPLKNYDSVVAKSQLVSAITNLLQ